MRVSKRDGFVNLSIRIWRLKALQLMEKILTLVVFKGEQLE